MEERHGHEHRVHRSVRKPGVLFIIPKRTCSRTARWLNRHSVGLPDELKRKHIISFERVSEKGPLDDAPARSMQKKANLIDLLIELKVVRKTTAAHCSFL